MSDIGVCQQCGAPVRWAQRDDGSGRTHPPLELGSEETRFIVLEDRWVRSTKSYTLHHCSELEQRAYRVNKPASVRRPQYGGWRPVGNHDVREEYAKYKRTVYELAMRNDCPRCDAQTGERCENLASRKADRLAYTAFPHEERRELIHPAEHPYWHQHGYVITPHSPGAP